MNDLHEVIDGAAGLAQGYLHRQGFLFTGTRPSNVFDAIVIRHPPRSQNRQSRHFPPMSYSIEEHVELINKYGIEKAVIIAQDISFLRQCPTLKEINLWIADATPGEFDFSPLYDMPQLRDLDCHMTYDGPDGPDDPRSAVLDCTQLRGLTTLSVYEKPPLNYELVETLESLFVSENRKHKDLTRISRSQNLKRLWMMCGSLRSLEGIEQFRQLESLTLDYLRSLQDISQLSCVAKSLRALSIENCPKIQDFGCLCDLVNLEHLDLCGSNKLPDLKFLNGMKKLKTFIFSMDVVDCDLTPCLQVPYALSYNNKKKYNLKDKDLPKNRSEDDEPFEII